MIGARHGRASPAIAYRAPGRSGRLLRRFVVPLVALVGGALLASGGLEVWFSYRESKEALALIQSEKALAAAGRIEQFIDEITRQIGFTTRAKWAAEALEQRRIEYLQLLRQAPAVTEIAHLDAGGLEELRVSRLAMDRVGSRDDYSHDPRYTEARAQERWYSPVYFHRESEPFMTIAIAGTGRDSGVTVAEVNLKLMWDVIHRIKVGRAGYAYVVDARGLLIAHPDIGLVLRKTDLSALPQVQDALAPTSARVGSSIGVGSPNGPRVLTAHATVAPTGWLLFVDLPLAEAFAPLYASAQRTGGLMLLGLALAVLAALILARRITEPVRVLQAGADRLGGGDLDYRIELRTGDDLESLATAFNAMADRLRESYSSLERKVEERTGELSRSLAAEAASARENERLVDELTARSEALARSVEELRALGAAGEAMVGTLDLGRVLDTLLPKAAALANADSALLFRYRRERKELELWRDHDLPDGLAEDIARTPYLPAEPIVGRALGERRTQVIDDAAAVSGSTLAVRLRQAGYPALIVVPLARGRRAIGAIALLYRDPARIPERAADLMQTFASQSILAIQNARLFREIEEKGRQLELASQHKSQFLANMSHELRTPLNAILGYAELLADELYGPLGAQQRDVLGRVQANGHHLLNLINDVLDLSKIEAGQLRLAIDDYSLADVVRSVVSATESLAAGKGLALEAAVADGLPPGRGDDRRLTQVLFNLVGNAVKFTDTGRVEIRARENAGRFVVEVIDTGPGIRDADQAWIFQEFQQVDNTSTRKKGGSGLGLAISRRIVELHGGTLSVESEPGRGSTFRVVVPVITAADDAP